MRIPGRACAVVFTVAGAQSAEACFRYDEDERQFTYEWRVGKVTGSARINAAVRYPGTSTQTSLTLPITITLLKAGVDR